MADWFETLTGFREAAYPETQSRFEVADGRLTSRANGRSWAVGRFDMVALADLRAHGDNGPAKVSVVRGDVRRLHADPDYAGALFQVASQFNALEMTAPELTPEDGVTRYVWDPTQGPACALAAAPATIYRNYLVPVGDGVGQTRARQLDGLAELGAHLGAALARPVADLWTMRNGYALATAEGLEAIARWLAEASPEEVDALRGRLAIGLHRDVEVTQAGAPEGQKVSQAFCSALPVAYGAVAPALWRPFATLVLEAAYEATLRAAALIGARIVALTLLGGGAFGNDLAWILAALRRALRRAGGGLDVRIVSHGRPPAAVLELAEGRGIAATGASD